MRSLITHEEREVLETAIKMYVEMGIINRICCSTESFLARVPGITSRRLQTLIKNHSQEIAAMAGAKDVVYIKGEYKPSGRGAFGRQKGGERATIISSSIKFVY